MALGGILDAVAAWTLATVELLGYPGVFILMVMESMIFPVPSEAVLPPAGWLAAEGRFSFTVALLVATAGTVVGSLLSYAMGAYGLRPLLDRYGKYVMVSPHHLAKTEAFFLHRRAAWGIFLSRFVPVVRHLISIPAGSARMPLVPFVLATAAGGFLWNLILIYAGFVLGENWHSIEPVLDDAKVVIGGTVLLAALAAVAWYVLRRRAART